MRELFAKQADPYADADREAARRWAGLLFLVQSALVVGLSPLGPPTERIGEAGWAVLAGMVVVQLAIAWLLLRRGERVGDNVLLSFNYLAVAVIALLTSLTGEIASAYLPLLVFWVVFTPSSHPPRRVVPFLLFVAAAMAVPFLFEGWQRHEGGQMASWLIVMVALAAVVMLRVRSYREVRIGLARSGEEAMQLAVTDPLTGLANRRAFAEVIKREAARAEDGGGGGPLTLVLADLDGFKQLNDVHGHVKGDQYLRRVADTIKSMLREQDLAFRWGGDEFALLLRDTDREAANGVCERLGGVVRAALYETAGVPMSLSFGIAVYGPGTSAEELVAEADTDLMGDKERERIG